MSITLTANYRDTLAPETLAIVDRYLAYDFELGPMLEFIDERSESGFRDYYETYVELGEDYGYEAVDAFLETTSYVEDLKHFQDAYIGEYHNPRDMAEGYFDGDGDVERLDYRIVIDWAETAEYLLQHDVDRVGDFYFKSSY